MRTSFRKYGLLNSYDIQNTSREYNVGMTLTLILLQETSFCCLYLGAVVTKSLCCGKMTQLTFILYVQLHQFEFTL